jgi:hypothetical protein
MTLEQMIREMIREEMRAVRPEPAVDLTLRQFAALYGRHEETIRQWCVQGKVPDAYLFMGREWRIPAASVEKLQEQERERWSESQDQHAALGQ